MLEDVLKELAAAVRENTAAILACGGAPETATAPTTSTPATPEAGGKRKPGRPAGSSPATQPPAASTPAKVTLDEIRNLFNPWMNGDDSKKRERGSAVQKVLDQYRDKPGQPLAEIKPEHYAAIYKDIKALIDAEAAPAAEDDFSNL